MTVSDYFGFRWSCSRLKIFIAEFISSVTVKHLYCMLIIVTGVHPHDAKSWNDSSLTELRGIAENIECVAIGECGLDYNRDFSPASVQQQVFEIQVQYTRCVHKKTKLFE